MRAFGLIAFLITFDSALSQCDDVSDVTFYLIQGEGAENLDPISIPWNDIGKLLHSSNYDNTKATVVYAHGYTEDYPTLSVQTVLKAYITRRNEFNIFFLDWSKYAGGNYFLQALPNLVKVGTHIGIQILKMASLGFNIEKFHFVGHSLGAQLMGQVGRTVKYSPNQFILTRISGLDPAGPAFYPLNPFVYPLNAGDAKFVDIIHTDSIAFGGNVATGHADFWPNGGSKQPKCPPLDYNNFPDPENRCSHHRSWRYWSESVLNSDPSKSFFVTKCDSWCNFIHNNCSNDPQSSQQTMGILADPAMHGSFYLQTNGESPFSLGAAGAKYENYTSH